MKSTKLFAGLLMVTVVVALTACLKKKYDLPPDESGYDPKLTVTHSIKQLKALNGPYNYQIGGDTSIITQDVIVSGIVTADDRSGNLYKQIVIQDTSGAIMLKIDAYSLYTHYPVGRKVYIKCKGLWLGYDGGLPVLGSKPDEQMAITGMTGIDIDNHIVKANVGNPVKSDTLDLIQAKNNAGNPDWYNRLITIREAEFVAGDTGKTYTQPNGTTNRTIEDCAATANTLVIRSSNYATFHNTAIPKGKGTISGIYTVFISSTSGNKTPQMLIRDTSDVKMNGARCAGPAPAQMITIDSLRKMYPGSGTFTLPSVKIQAVVISDIDKGNASSGNFVIEDNSKKGVILYISGSTAYKLGDSLVVDCTGGTLELYQGAMELSGLTISKVTKVTTGKSITPTTLTIAQLNAGFAGYESTLIKIVNATISGSGTTYSGNKTLTDASGNIILYTASGATFSGSTFPTGPKTITAIPTWFNTTKEIKLRDPAIDVQ